jgi:hypothetical protein
MVGRHTGGAVCTLFVRSGPTYTYLFSDNLAENKAFSAEMWVALEPGDELGVQSSAADGFAYFISGSQLDGIAP